MSEIRFFLKDEEYGWLSNFHRSTMVVDGIEYMTNEHFYQSRKANSWETAEWIRLAPNPYLAMKAGRALRTGKQEELRPNWDDMKLTYMLECLRLKFSDPELRKKLIATGDAMLIENNPDDPFWGCGRDGKGANHLGKLLMKVREQCKQGYPPLGYYRKDGVCIRG